MRILDRPELRSPIWIGAFKGWSDAQEGATRAVRYLAYRLEARKFIELDPEEFYDFTAVRPFIFTAPDGRRVLRWPSNELFYWKNPAGERDLILFSGIEPSLKWRAYTQALMDVISGYSVSLVTSLGSLRDAIPHTRAPIISASGNTETARSWTGGLRAMGTGYQGPVGIGSVLIDSCTNANIDHVSLWAHAPHYLPTALNYKVARSLVAHLNTMFGLAVPLDELDRRSEAFEEEMTKLVAANVELSTYVKQLERSYDETVGAEETGLPPPQVVVEELEKFLKQGGSGPEPFSAN